MCFWIVQYSFRLDVCRFCLNNCVTWHIHANFTRRSNRLWTHCPWGDAAIILHVWITCYYIYIYIYIMNISSEFALRWILYNLIYTASTLLEPVLRSPMANGGTRRQLVIWWPSHQFDFNFRFIFCWSKSNLIDVERHGCVFFKK